MNQRLLAVTLFHAVFACYIDIQGVVINYMSVPLSNLFNESLIYHYGIDANPSEFKLIFSAIASTSFIGLLIGGLTMGYFMDKYGRKGTAIYLRTALAITSSLCLILSKHFLSIELFVFGYFLGGMVATFKVVLFIYLAECSPDNLRGFTSMTVGSGGMLIVLLITPFCVPNILANDEHWIWVPGISLIMELIYISVASMFPESPKHLHISKGNKTEAEFAIRFYHGNDVDMDSIEFEYEREKDLMHQTHISIKEVWSNEQLRWSLALCLVGSFIPGFSAVSIKSAYLATMFISYGMDRSGAVFAITLLNILVIPICLTIPYLIEKLGRRPIFLSIAGLCAFEWLCYCIAQSFVDFHLMIHWFSSSLGFLGALCGQAALNLGLLNMTPILVSELCAHAARAAISEVVQVIPLIICFLMVLLYPSAVTKFGFATYIPLVVISTTLFYLLYKNLPETRGLPVDKIVRRLEVTRSRHNTIRSLVETHHVHYGSFANSDEETLILNEELEHRD